MKISKGGLEIFPKIREIYETFKVENFIPHLYPCSGQPGSREALSYSAVKLFSKNSNVRNSAYGCRPMCRLASIGLLQSRRLLLAALERV